MSRIGKLPIPLPQGVEVALDGQNVTVKGPKGTLSHRVHDLVQVMVEDGVLKVDIADKEDGTQKALWGLSQRLLANMVAGVTVGFKRQLEVNGVGYKVAAAGKNLTLNLGYSHPIDFVLPEGVEAVVEKNLITLSSIDKQLVGETAARIRRYRKPEPYKGKGIKYVEEVIRRKAGKAAKAGK